MKTRLSESEAEAEEPPITKSGIEHCHWFILPLLLATPTMQYSLDRKRRSHKQNQCSVSDSVGRVSLDGIVLPSEYDPVYDSVPGENQPLSSLYKSMYMPLNQDDKWPLGATHDF